ncbi:MAG TPA: hypothetical protein VK540_17845, partial [Polyangiaceae bacterium]|nr:hypothetical protein [Polyangiaceae bacterium]
MNDPEKWLVQRPIAIGVGGDKRGEFKVQVTMCHVSMRIGAPRARLLAKQIVDAADRVDVMNGTAPWT